MHKRFRGFTGISELFKGAPQGLTSLINRFLTPMSDLILERSGTIDKYMGDCIMAFWNAPLDDAKHGRHACESALAMFGELTALNADIKAEREAAGELFRPIKSALGSIPASAASATWARSSASITRCWAIP